jgi:hypothetical protein
MGGAAPPHHAPAAAVRGPQRNCQVSRVRTGETRYTLVAMDTRTIAIAALVIVVVVVIIVFVL